MLEALPKALAQVKVGNTTENLLNKIRQIILYLYHVKEITRNLYHIINLVELWYKIDTIFTNSESSKNYDPTRGEKVLFYVMLVFTTRE